MPDERPNTEHFGQPGLRPVLTLHLPVPMDLLVAVQSAFITSYPALADAPASEVMRSTGDTVEFCAPEEAK